MCSLHFKPDDYEINAMNEMLCIPYQKKLKKGVIPSLLLTKDATSKIKEGKIDYILSERENRWKERQQSKLQNLEYIFGDSLKKPTQPSVSELSSPSTSITAQQLMSTQSQSPQSMNIKEEDDRIKPVSDLANNSENIQIENLTVNEQDFSPDTLEENHFELAEDPLKDAQPNSITRAENKVGPKTGRDDQAKPSTGQEVDQPNIEEKDKEEEDRIKPVSDLANNSDNTQKETLTVNEQDISLDTLEENHIEVAEDPLKDAQPNSITSAENKAKQIDPDASKVQSNRRIFKVISPETFQRLQRENLLTIRTKSNAQTNSKLKERIKTLEAQLAETKKREDKLKARNQILEMRSSVKRDIDLNSLRTDPRLIQSFQWLSTENAKQLQWKEIYYSKRFCHIVCSICGKDFENDKLLIQHFMLQHLMEEMEMKQLNNVMRKSDSDPVLPTSCPLFCDHQTKSEMDFVQHLIWSHFKNEDDDALDDGSKRKCPARDCYFVTERRRRLTNHKLLHLQKLVARKEECASTCEECEDKKFQDTSAWLTHHGVFHLELSHEKVKEFLTEESSNSDEMVVSPYLAPMNIKKGPDELADEEWEDFEPLKHDKTKSKKMGSEDKDEDKEDRDFSPGQSEEDLSDDLVEPMVKKKRKKKKEFEIGCKHCYFRAESKFRMIIHYHNVHPDLISECVNLCKLEKILSCETCDFGCDDVASLSYHRDSHLFQMNCKECDLQFKTVREAKKHHLETHQTSFTCEKCGVIVETLKKLKYHKNNHHSRPRVKKIFPCELCGMMISSRYMELHKRSAHFKPYQCDKCPYRCGLKRNFIRHIQSVHEGGFAYDYVCQLCGNRFSIRKYLIRHMRNVHKVDPNTMQPLDVPDKAKVKRVRKKKLKELKENKCRLCHNIFNQDYSLPVHYREFHKVDARTLKPLDLYDAAPK